MLTLVETPNETVRQPAAPILAVGYDDFDVCLMPFCLAIFLGLALLFIISGDAWMLFYALVFGWALAFEYPFLDRNGDPLEFNAP